MASAALIVKDDGNIEATPELIQVLDMKPGTRLELIEHSARGASFQVPAVPREIKIWQDFQGYLADSSIDLNEERRKARQRELDSEIY